MRIAFVQSTRLPQPPLWAVAIVLFWMGGVALFSAVRITERTGAQLCNFKRVTGLPCPTCGGTRAGLAILNGDVATAFSLNPLLVGIAVLGGVLLVLRMLFARWPQLQASTRGWCMVAAGAFLLLALNWVYLIARGM